VSFPIDVRGLIPLLGQGATYTLERFTTASSINAVGRPVVPTPTSLPRTMVVHQATRKQVERAGLDHTVDWRAFYDTEELRVAGAGGQGDVVQYQGERWELHNLADYQAMGGMYMALGKRIEE
jgi:hypothetical protein